LPPPLNLVERFLRLNCREDSRPSRRLVRAKTFDMPVNKRDLKDSQQRAIASMDLEEDAGEAAALRAEIAELRRRNAELVRRNADLEGLAASYLLEAAPGGAAARRRAANQELSPTRRSGRQATVRGGQPSPFEE